MRISNATTDRAVLEELGGRLARTRLERNLTQAQLAHEAGIAPLTVLRLERGDAVRLTSLVRVLRVLDLLDALDRLIPEPMPSPIELVKLRGHRRRRASGARAGPRHGLPAASAPMGRRPQPIALAGATPAAVASATPVSPAGATPAAVASATPVSPASATPAAPADPTPSNRPGPWHWGDEASGADR
jgi:transcriptional regulator with XRE-family HTH domain